MREILQKLEYSYNKVVMAVGENFDLMKMHCKTYHFSTPIHISHWEFYNDFLS